MDHPADCLMMDYLRRVDVWCNRGQDVVQGQYPTEEDERFMARIECRISRHSNWVQEQDDPEEQMFAWFRNYRSFRGLLNKAKFKYVIAGRGVLKNLFGLDPILTKEIFNHWCDQIADKNYDPSIRNNTVIKLAIDISENDNYDNTPILADALEEAGYQNQAVLFHLRDVEYNAQHHKKCPIVKNLLA